MAFTVSLTCPRHVAVARGERGRAHRSAHHIRLSPGTPAILGPMISRANHDSAEGSEDSFGARRLDAGRERLEAGRERLERIEDKIEQKFDQIKPRLRGWLHAGTFPLSVLLGAILVILAPDERTRVSSAVFAVTASMLFGVSALYHRGTWSPRAHGVLKRMDHANIFLII